MFTPDMIPRKGGRVIAGLRVTRPDGALWRRLRTAAFEGKDVRDRVKAFGAEISDTSQLRISREEERINTQLATEVIKAWNAIIGNCEANDFQEVYIEKQLETRAPRDSVRALAAKSRIKSKDCLANDGIIPPPKGIKAMLRHELTQEWHASMANEISSLTEMGTITQ